MLVTSSWVFWHCKTLYISNDRLNCIITCPSYLKVVEGSFELVSCYLFGCIFWRFEWSSYIFDDPSCLIHTQSFTLCHLPTSQLKLKWLGNETTYHKIVSKVHLVDIWLNNDILIYPWFESLWMYRFYLHIIDINMDLSAPVCTWVAGSIQLDVLGILFHVQR